MHPDGAIQISPHHHVMLDEDYWPMIDRPPRDDFVVRILAQRTAGDMPLMTAEMVIASERTRQTYPLAARYPLHFRKTYYPGSMFGDPAREHDRQTLASTLTEVPAPIGCTRTTFRSCLLPGRPLDQLSKLGAEPDASNIALARALSLPAAAGLWRIAQEADALLQRMHAGGLAHGDAHLHNFLVCPSPLQVLPIDFERSVLRDDLAPEAWQRHCEEDRQHLLRLAVFLQCTLGGQRDDFGALARARLDGLVEPAESFRRAIAERTYAGAITS